MAVQNFILSYFAYIVYAAQVAKSQCNLLPKNRLRSAKLIGNSKPCFLTTFTKMKSFEKHSES